MRLTYTKTNTNTHLSTMPSAIKSCPADVDRTESKSRQHKSMTGLNRVQVYTVKTTLI